MDIRNVMVGDWVFNGTQAIQLTEEMMTQDIISKMNPIPLTQEIMYKNTYNVESNDYAVYVGEHNIQYHLGDFYVVKYNSDLNIYSYEGIVLKYVNDLQHLMKLSEIKREVILN